MHPPDWWPPLRRRGEGLVRRDVTVAIQRLERSTGADLVTQLGLVGEVEEALLLQRRANSPNPVVTQSPPLGS